MAKYQVGDTFLCEITEVDESGMGTLYVLSESLNANETVLNNFERVSGVQKKVSKPKKKEYTPEDLKNQIFALSKMLADTVETYQRITQQSNEVGATADALMNKIGGKNKE